MTLSDGFQLAATAPNGVARLRGLILSLAVAGKLVRQNSADEPAQTLLRKIRAEKDRLVAAGTISAGKPLTEIGDEERPFDLPSGWQWVRFGDYIFELCTGPFGSVIHKEDYVKDGIPLINPSHMVHGHILHDPSVSVSAQMAEQLSAYRLSAGDIVLARRGEVGRYAHVTSEQEGWLCGTGSFFVKLADDCDRRFMGLVFQDPRMRAYLQGESVGMTMTNLNQRILLEAPLAIPPIAEQTRIVAKVDELMALCDDLEIRGRVEAEQHARLIATLFDALAASESSHALAENWSRVAAHLDLLLDRPEAVDALEQTILQLAVRGLLVKQEPQDEPADDLLKQIRAEKDRLIAAGKIKRDKPLPLITTDDEPFTLPSGWTWARFGNVAQISSNLVDPTKHGSMRQVAPDCIEKRTGRLTEVRSVKEAGVTSPNHRFRPGQILYSKIRPSLSKAVVVDFDGLCSADMYPVDSHIDANYLHRYILSRPFLEQVSAAENRIKMPKLNQEALNSFLIAVPPRAEQLRIVRRFEEMRCLCADLRKRLADRQFCQARFAEALVEQAESAARLGAHTEDLAAAA